MGQDRTEENGVATFHLSQNGMYAINMEAELCYAIYAIYQTSQELLERSP